MADRQTSIMIAGEPVHADDPLVIVRERSRIVAGEERTRTKRIRGRFKYAEDGTAWLWRDEGTGQGWRAGSISPHTFLVGDETILEWIETDAGGPPEGTAAWLIGTISKDGFPDGYLLPEDMLQAMGDDGVKWTRLHDTLTGMIERPDVEWLDACDAADEFLDHHDYCQTTYLQ